jgi:multidrug efflux pump subunit AcrA (membrane-fusion protein)
MVDRVEVTAKSQEDGSLVYRGRVVVDDALEAPEGTEVRVTIIVDRADSVLTVPLASLVSDADGSAAVQVVEVDGSVKTVPVVLGLSEGAWVEVVSGLNGDEQVLVAGQ